MGPATDRIGTLGILGGGQLARMTALAARQLGYEPRVLDPSRSCPARTVVEEVVEAPLSSSAFARAFARACDVLTLDTEHVPAELLADLARLTEVHPGAHVLAVVQDRGVQKRWLQRHGYPVGAFRHTRSEDELQAAFDALPGAVYVKQTRQGYDGRGQRRYAHPPAAAQVIGELGTHELLVESVIPFHCELSVMVARGRRGDLVVYPAAQNEHVDGILASSLFPAPVAEAVQRRARALAASVAIDLDVCGLLCVEMFLTEGGDLLVNELAPRPHNSYHAAERGAHTGQFEQLVRAVCGLSLGSVAVRQPAAMHNLLGDLWLGVGIPDLRAALMVPGITVHLYGKQDARPRRKMGHLTAVADTPALALELVQQARALLVPIYHQRNGVLPNA